MAKSLLKHMDLSCDSLQVEEGDDASLGCQVIPLLRDIINTQNAQIVDMEEALKLMNKDLYDDCVVEDMADVDVGRRDKQTSDTPVYQHAIECTPCADTGGICVIEVKVDFYTSELGHYIVEGCSGANPTLLLEVGRTYKFDQSDLSNWYHLIGFAYEADGAHVPVRRSSGLRLNLMFCLYACRLTSLDSSSSHPLFMLTRLRNWNPEYHHQESTRLAQTAISAPLLCIT